MSNGDHDYKFMVVRAADDGASDILCYRGSEPAIFNDSPPAELLCMQLRTAYPDCRYRVLQLQVL